MSKKKEMEIKIKSFGEGYIIEIKGKNKVQHVAETVDKIKEVVDKAIEKTFKGLI